MNYIVKTTNIPDFTGIDAGNVAFANGIAITTDARMAAWFREHDGYEVTEQVEEPTEELPEAQKQPKRKSKAESNSEA